ncbi:MAG: thioredoxin family protein [Planctomycetota bacterium]|jgi:thiol-disulfide isomerase/thioredoxin
MRPYIPVPEETEYEPEPIPGARGPGGPNGPVILLILLVVVLGLGAAGWKVLGPGKGGWLDNLDDGFDAADRSGTPVLAFFTADWCPPCRRLKQGVFSDPGVMASLAEDYVLVKIDLTNRQGDNNWVASDAGVKYIPTIIIYEDGYEAKRFGATEFESWVYYR